MAEIVRQAAEKLLAEIQTRVDRYWEEVEKEGKEKSTS